MHEINANHKETEIAILIEDKICYRTRNVVKDNLSSNGSHTESKRFFLLQGSVADGRLSDSLFQLRWL